MSGSWRNVFEQAVERTLEDIKSQAFEILSEKDIQALIFHHSLTLAAEYDFPLKIHAEPTRAGKLKPDLVLGDNAVFVEVKLSKPNQGGYTQAKAAVYEDVRKLSQYKLRWPESQCLFLCFDEQGSALKQELHCARRILSTGQVETNRE